MTHESEVECDKCHKILKNNRSFRRHVCPTAPLGERVKCTICNRSFKNKHSVYSHKYTHHMKRTNEDIPVSSVEKEETDPKTSQDESSPNTAIPPLDDDLSQVKPKTRGPGLSLRENFKAKMFKSMWGCLRYDTSFPYSLLDVYLIKNKFFRDINEFFDFKLKTILNEREQALVNAMCEIESLEEIKIILNENFDILVEILVKTTEWSFNGYPL